MVDDMDVRVDTSATFEANAMPMAMRVHLCTPSYVARIAGRSGIEM
jgi:hypothetical protein